MSDNNTEEKTPHATSAAEHPEMRDRIEAADQSMRVHRGLSVTVGLREIPDSVAPAMSDGTKVSHVMGPQQAPCDPIAAGLDLEAHPLSRAENRMITRTGVIGSGNRPATYVEKGDFKNGDVVSDESVVPAPMDEEAAGSPGPNSVPAGDLTSESSIKS